MRWLKRQFRRFALLLGLAPAWVIRLPDGEYEFHFLIRVRWWASREDIYATVALARSDGVIPPGPLCYDETLNSVE